MRLVSIFGALLMTGLLTGQDLLYQLPAKSWGPVRGVYIEASTHKTKLVFEDAEGTIRLAYLSPAEDKIVLTGTIKRRPQ